MEQHPTGQIRDDELVEIADRPQLWISRDGYAKTLRAGLVRAAHITDRGRSPYPGPLPAEMYSVWQRTAQTDAIDQPLERTGIA